MLHALAIIFSVTGNLENFLVFFFNKTRPRYNLGASEGFFPLPDSYFFYILLCPINKRIFFYFHDLWLTVRLILKIIINIIYLL